MVKELIFLSGVRLGSETISVSLSSVLSQFARVQWPKGHLQSCFRLQNRALTSMFQDWCGFGITVFLALWFPRVFFFNISAVQKLISWHWFCFLTGNINSFSHSHWNHFSLCLTTTIMVKARLENSLMEQLLQTHYESNTFPNLGDGMPTTASTLWFRYLVNTALLFLIYFSSHAINRNTVQHLYYLQWLAEISSTNLQAYPTTMSCNVSPTIL